jgi:hypothetical protein
MKAQLGGTTAPKQLEADAAPTPQPVTAAEVQQPEERS